VVVSPKKANPNETASKSLADEAKKVHFIIFTHMAFLC